MIIFNWFRNLFPSLKQVVWSLGRHKIDGLCFLGLMPRTFSYMLTLSYVSLYLFRSQFFSPFYAVVFLASGCSCFSITEMKCKSSKLFSALGAEIFARDKRTFPSCRRLMEVTISFPFILSVLQSISAAI